MIKPLTEDRTVKQRVFDVEVGVVIEVVEYESSSDNCQWTTFLFLKLLLTASRGGLQGPLNGDRSTLVMSLSSLPVYPRCP